MSHCDCECVGEQSENEKVSWLSVIYIKKTTAEALPTLGVLQFTKLSTLHKF